MHVMNRMLPVALTLALVFAVAPLSPSPSLLAQAQAQAMSAEGELVRVDVDQKTFAIRTADDRELQFSYTDTTEIVGAQSGSEGLATMKGSQVSVSYHAENRVAIATRIEISPKA